MGMKEIIKNLFILISILFVLFYTLDTAFTEIYKKGNFYKTQWLNHMKCRDFDYAILGSSRSYTTIDVGDINQNTGCRGINISIDGSVTSTHDLVLKLFIQNNNQVEKLLLQVDPWHVNLEQPAKFSFPRFFPYYDNKLVYEHYKNFGIKFVFYKYIPFLRYAEYNTNWGLHQLLNSIYSIKEHPFDEYGTLIYPTLEYQDDKMPTEYVFNISKPTLYLDNIIETCHSEDIELICFTSPYASVLCTEKYYNSISTFTKYLEEKGVKYYNFGDLFNERFELFTDKTHLNRNGVKVFTPKITAILQK